MIFSLYADPSAHVSTTITTKTTKSTEASTLRASTGAGPNGPNRRALRHGSEPVMRPGGLVPAAQRPAAWRRRIAVAPPGRSQGGITALLAGLFFVPFVPFVVEG